MRTEHWIVQKGLNTPRRTRRLLDRTSLLIECNRQEFKLNKNFSKVSLRFKFGKIGLGVDGVQMRLVSNQAEPFVLETIYRTTRVGRMVEILGTIILFFMLWCCLRKRFYSVSCQIISDGKFLIHDLVIYPGSSNDEWIRTDSMVKVFIKMQVPFMIFRDSINLKTSHKAIQ